MIPSVIRAEPPRDDFGASLRDGMERRDARARFYSPKAIPRKERRDWTRIPIGDSNGKKSVAGVEKMKTSPDRWDHGVSDAREEMRQRAQVPM
jgi:hypothetical protein